MTFRVNVGQMLRKTSVGLQNSLQERGFNSSAHSEKDNQIVVQF